MKTWQCENYKDSFRFTWYNCWFKDGFSLWIWKASFILSWKLVEVWSKIWKQSCEHKVRQYNAQNSVDVWKCERPCHWLSAHARVWKNTGLFRRHNRHYSPHMQTYKPHANEARPFDNLFPLSPTVSINLLKIKSKDFYWLITNKSVTKATGPRKWEHETQRMNLNWPCYFSKLKLICKERKLREFYYKFLHRIIATRKKLYCFGIESNKDCLYCNESDSIGHTFIDCHKSKYFLNTF